MTKSTITRERLEKIKSWRETYGAGSNVMLPAEEAEALARIALAAMDSEPVAEVCEEYALRYISHGPAPREGLRPGDKLYRHAQQPVLPEDVSGPLAHAYKELTPTFIRNHIAVFERYGIAPNDSSTVIQALRIALDGIERRAAMLQTGNSPVIPEGYVMVPKEPTERMVIDGFESEPDEAFSEPEVWEAYQKMSGCEQAAFRARLCWAAMIAATI